MSIAANARVGPRVPVADDIEIATYHLGGDGPPLMLLHATGFHGRCWSRLAAQLTGRFSVWAIDQRGHGASGKPKLGGLGDWSKFVDDLLTVLDHLDGSTWFGMGHSLGGAVLLMGAARRPGAFETLCCYEPVVFPPVTHEREAGTPEREAGTPEREAGTPEREAGTHEREAGTPEREAGTPEREAGTPEREAGTPERGTSLAVVARKRRHSFGSRAEALQNYRSKPPFQRFDAATLEAYVEFGFVDAPDGSVTLACRREDEASVFEGAGLSRGFESLERVRSRVSILAGVDTRDPVSRVGELAANRLPEGSCKRISGLDHFGPMCDPDRVGAEAAQALRP